MMVGFGRSLEKKAMIVRRTSMVPGGYRLRYQGGGRIEFQGGADQAEGSLPAAVFADGGNWS